jgi:hypothetical protein
MSYPGLIFDGDDAQSGSEEFLDEIVFFVVEHRPSERPHVADSVGLITGASVFSERPITRLSNPLDNPLKRPLK